MRILFFVTNLIIVGGCTSLAGGSVTYADCDQHSSYSDAIDRYISWEAPRENTDNEKIDPATLHYKIYTVTIDDNNGKVMPVHHEATAYGTVNTCILKLDPQAEFIAITAVDTDGEESDFSNVVASRSNGSRFR